MGAFSAEFDARKASKAPSAAKNRCCSSGHESGSELCQAGRSLHHRERPIEQIAHVGKDLDGPAASAVEVGEGRGRVFEGPRGAVSESGEGMAEQVGFRVHAENIAQLAARKGLNMHAKSAR